MKFLIIEDDHDKAKSIEDFITSLSLKEGIEFDIKTNYQDGKRALRDSYDFLILDMTLPLDAHSVENKVATAGIDILEIMKHRNVIKPCVVLTQYDTFGKHQNKVNLSSLTKKVNNEYGEIVKQVLFYDAADGEWCEEMKIIIQEVT